MFLSETKTHTLTSHLVPRPARFLAWQLNSPSIPSVTWMAVLMVMVLVLTMIVVMIKNVKEKVGDCLSRKPQTGWRLRR